MKLIPGMGNKIDSNMLEQGLLDMGHARALLALDNDKQRKAAQQIADAGMSVRQAESLVRRMLEGPADKKGRRDKDPDVRHLEESLSERLGTQVEIRLGSKGKGKLIIDFHSNDVLEGILEKIR